MQIDSVLPNRVSPGQSVIIQGDGLAAAEKVFFGDAEVSFQVDGETLVVDVPEGSGTVEVRGRGGGWHERRLHRHRRVGPTSSKRLRGASRRSLLESL